MLFILIMWWWQIFPLLLIVTCSTSQQLVFQGTTDILCKICDTRKTRALVKPSSSVLCAASEELHHTVTVTDVDLHQQQSKVMQRCDLSASWIYSHYWCLQCLLHHITRYPHRRWTAQNNMPDEFIRRNLADKNFELIKCSAFTTSSRLSLWS